MDNLSVIGNICSIISLGLSLISVVLSCYIANKVLKLNVNFSDKQDISRSKIKNSTVIQHKGGNVDVGNS